MAAPAPTGLARRWRGLVLPLLLLAAAEWAMRRPGANTEALAAPSAVALALRDTLLDGSVLRAGVETLGAALGGLALGGGLGLLTGLWLGLSRPADRGAALSIELLRPVPSVALIPVSMMVFGFGLRMEIAVVAFSCLWPMLLLARAAVRQVEPRLLEVAQVLRLGPLARLWKIVLPAALPRLFVALRVGVGIALVVAVTVEITANPHGLGFGLMSAQQNLQPERMLAMLVWIGALGAAVSALLHAAERRLFHLPMTGGAR